MLDSYRGQKIYLLARRYPSGTERLVLLSLTKFPVLFYSDTNTHKHISGKLHCSALVQRRQVDFEKTFCVFTRKMCKFPIVYLLVQFCKCLNFLFLSPFQSTFFCQHSRFCFFLLSPFLDVA